MTFRRLSVDLEALTCLLLAMLTTLLLSSTGLQQRWRTLQVVINNELYCGIGYVCGSSALLNWRAAVVQILPGVSINSLDNCSIVSTVASPSCCKNKRSYTCHCHASRMLTIYTTGITCKQFTNRSMVGSCLMSQLYIAQWI